MQSFALLIGNLISQSVFSCYGYVKIFGIFEISIFLFLRERAECIEWIFWVKLSRTAIKFPCCACNYVFWYMQKRHFNFFHVFPNFKLGKKVYKKKLLNSKLRNPNVLYHIKILWNFKNLPKKNSANFNKIRGICFAFRKSLKKDILFEVLN